MTNRFEDATNNLDFIDKDIDSVETNTDLIKSLGKYNPISQDIEFSNGSRIKYRFKPKFSFKNIWKKGLKNSRLELEFGHTFKEDDVDILINVNGEVFKLASGEGDADFNVCFKATKHF